MTLVEILVVLALIAIMAATAMAGSGSVGASRMRGAATAIVSLAKVAITRANATGHPVRMVFNLQTKTVGLEESATGRMLRAKPSASAIAAAAASGTPGFEKAAEREASSFLAGAQSARPSFVAATGIELGDERLEPEGHELGTHIEYIQVQSEHDEEPVTEGKAFLYFWPGGGTEWSSIQLRVVGQQEGLTILVSPLTGRARIKKGRLDLPKRSEEGIISEREGPR